MNKCRVVPVNAATESGRMQITRRSFVSGLLVSPIAPVFAASERRLNVSSTKIGPIRTVGEYAQALRFASTRNDAAVIDIAADWCEFCQTIIETIFPDETVAPLLARLALIRVDVTSMSQSNVELLRHLNVEGPPTVFVVNTITGKELPQTRSVGPFNAEDLAARLRPFVR